MSKAAANAPAKEQAHDDLVRNLDFEKIQKNEMLILEKHAEERYEEALELLEES